MPLLHNVILVKPFRTCSCFTSHIIKWQHPINQVSARSGSNPYIWSYFSTIKTLSWLSRCSISVVKKNYFSSNSSRICKIEQANRKRFNPAEQTLLDASKFPHNVSLCCPLRHMSVAPQNPSKGDEKRASATEDGKPEPEKLQEMEKLGLFKRYKKMLKEYWYVLLPVHFVTSIVWFGTFYYMAQSGFDVVPLLLKIGVSENFTASLQKSGLGHLAVATAMYKLATPARYFVTLGATTFTIKSLSKRGLLKPMPSKEQLKIMLKEKTKHLTQKN